MPLYSDDDDQIYYSLSQQVEQIIAGLPPDEGLDSLSGYRRCWRQKKSLAAADGPHDVRALQQVVRKYFISSLGDDAALTLSSIYMDDYDFVGAIRMLTERSSINTLIPAFPWLMSISRLAVCQALMGETKQARTRTSAKPRRCRLIPNRSTLSDIESLIDSDLPRLRLVPIAASATGFNTALANRSRTGLDATSAGGHSRKRPLTTIWQYHYLADRQEAGQI